MALTVGESHDVLRLLDWILGLEPEGRGLSRPPTPDEARECAARLADKAHKALMAGRDGARVRRDWDRVGPTVNRRGGKPR